MKQPTNMAELFEKLNELKSVFRYGQKLIPIIQNLIDFMQETVPLLENINSSIADSTSKIPKASLQISDVTEATELATTEILDIVDLINADIDSIEKDLRGLTEREKQKLEIIEELTEAVKDNANAKLLLKNYAELNNGNIALDSMLSALQKIKNDSYNITLSLQVQDITSQQLSAVNHLIRGVQDKLFSLLVDFQNTNTEELKNMKIAVPDDASFNPEARYNKGESQQQLADSLANKNGYRTTQDEIDKLFS